MGMWSAVGTAANVQPRTIIIRDELTNRNRVVGIEINPLNKPILRYEHDLLAILDRRHCISFDCPHLCGPSLAMHLARRFIATLLLLTYVSTGTSMVPAVMAMAAELEGSHESRVRLGESGAQVVLHHRQSEFTPAVNDHVRGLARVLVSLCQSDREGDHQMTTAQFAGNAGIERLEISKARTADELYNAQATQEWQHLLHISQLRVTRDDMFASQLSTSHQPPSLLTTIQLLI
jgi:hypothetical protein